MVLNLRIPEVTRLCTLCHKIFSSSISQDIATLQTKACLSSRFSVVIVVFFVLFVCFIFFFKEKFACSSWKKGLLSSIKLTTDAKDFLSTTCRPHNHRCRASSRWSVIPMSNEWNPDRWAFSSQPGGPSFTIPVWVFEIPRGCELYGSEASAFERSWLNDVRNYSTVQRKREADPNY